MKARSDKRRTKKRADPLATWDLATIELFASDDPSGEEVQALVPRLRAVLDRLNAAITVADTAPTKHLPAPAAISAEQREQQKKIRTLFDRMAEKSRAMQVLGVPERPARADDQFLFQQLQDLFRYFGNRARSVLGNPNATDEERRTFARQVTRALDDTRLPLDVGDSDEARARAKAVRLIYAVTKAAELIVDNKVAEPEDRSNFVLNVRSHLLLTYGAAPDSDTFQKLVDRYVGVIRANRKPQGANPPAFWQPMADAIAALGWGRWTAATTSSTFKSALAARRAGVADEEQ